MSSNPFSDLSIVESYEGWYATYGRRADRLEKSLLRWVLGRFKEAHSILEVGCGTGHFTRWLEMLGLNTVGIDVSPVMLAEGRRLGLSLVFRQMR
jgi:SAM-dependent methyltransferase